MRKLLQQDAPAALGENVDFSKTFAVRCTGNRTSYARNVVSVKAERYTQGPNTALRLTLKTASDHSVITGFSTVLSGPQNLKRARAVRTVPLCRHTTVPTTQFAGSHGHKLADSRQILEQLASSFTRQHQNSFKNAWISLCLVAIYPCG
jgi:hypothetical protein